MATGAWFTVKSLMLLSFLTRQRILASSSDDRASGSQSSLAIDICSPTQKKSQVNINSQSFGKNGVVIGTYPDIPRGEGNVFECSEEESEKISFSEEQHSQIACTLLDSSTPQSAKSHHSKSSSPTPLNTAEASRTSILIEDSPNEDADEHDGEMRSVFAHDSSYDIAHAVSQKRALRSTGMNQTEFTILESRKDSQVENEEVECPLCTFFIDVRDLSGRAVSSDATCSPESANRVV
eukprot:CAMPEP_0114475102 /NCGR_PEP_ID=MMETSP0104-20121206/13954_1 /TAXON_ID=37642 ORGANISM="Paraphysomonas imperforata, Strain PA2" /NCGR_SAMPLE_ID=MMETSP0104 /ASSEMBLY_ACC=CAM_ASM_000202 /LENGTH=236 /DNA_ID=CAMNT_0001649567 /DNA_START=143 /DNA_END=853 /DNA_ORIENTATION=-